MPESGISRSDYLNIKFGGKELAAPMYASMTQKAKEVGINFLEKIIKTPNTVLSHLLILLAKDNGKENEIKKEIYTSYFIMGEAIFCKFQKKKLLIFLIKNKNSGVPFFEINIPKNH